MLISAFSVLFLFLCSINTASGAYQRAYSGAFHLSELPSYERLGLTRRSPFLASSTDAWARTMTVRPRFLGGFIFPQLQPLAQEVGDDVLFSQGKETFVAARGLTKR